MKNRDKKENTTYKKKEIVTSSLKKEKEDKESNISQGQLNQSKSEDEEVRKRLEALGYI